MKRNRTALQGIIQAHLIGVLVLAPVVIGAALARPYLHLLERVGLWPLLIAGPGAAVVLLGIIVRYIPVPAQFRGPVAWWLGLQVLLVQSLVAMPKGSVPIREADSELFWLAIVLSIGMGFAVWLDDWVTRRRSDA